MATTYKTYDLYSLKDGSVVGDVRTNDNRDVGEPSEYAEFPVVFPNRATALKVCGTSRTGWAGREITVRFNGTRV